MYYLYIIYSAQADKYYVGISANAEERLMYHNTNKIEKYTGKFQDWELKAVYAVSEERGETIKVEKFVKQQKSRKFIEMLILNQSPLTGKLAHLVRVPNRASRD
jgi:putative endonuclease